MNDMERVKFKSLLLAEIRGSIRGALIADVLRQSLDRYKAEYLTKQGCELSTDGEANFLSTQYVRDSARNEADRVIDNLVDRLITEFEENYRPDGMDIFRRVFSGITAVACVHVLFLYSWIGYSYLEGKQEALTSITRGNVIEALVTGCIFIVLFIVACIREWKK